jgi:RHS repeat-associated protein
MVATNNGWGYVWMATNRYVYDGWNLIAELDHQNLVVRSFTWGQDLSGKTPRHQKNAGGVGGLLMVRDHAASTTHFAGFDGNGNVTALIKTDGTTSARYEYSPFGELIRSTGPLARANPFRWSTKFTDEESGLVYYGARYYGPTLGRWLNRDPIAQQGGLNIYGFIQNSPVNGIDFDGMEFSFTGALTTMGIGGVVGGLWNSATGKSFIEGFAVGAIGAGVGYLGAYFLGSVVIGGALGGAADNVAGLIGEGELDKLGTGAGFGRLAFAMIAGGVAGKLGATLTDILGDLARGAGRTALAERIEEIGLDATLALAGSVGSGVASVFWDAYEEAAGAVTRLGSGASNAWENASE